MRKLFLFLTLMLVFGLSAVFVSAQNLPAGDEGSAAEGGIAEESNVDDGIVADDAAGEGAVEDSSAEVNAIEESAPDADGSDFPIVLPDAGDAAGEGANLDDFVPPIGVTTEGGATKQSSKAFFNILAISVILLCIAINGMILAQKKKSAGLSGSISGMGAVQTYWDKNKGRSLEGTLEKYTKICGAAFMIICLILNVVM